MKSETTIDPPLPKIERVSNACVWPVRDPRYEPIRAYATYSPYPSAAIPTVAARP